MATPILDKARTAELTLCDIVAALKELESLSGAGSSAVIELHRLGASVRARITWQHIGGGSSRWCPSIEDALVAEHDELKRCMAESAS